MIMDGEEQEDEEGLTVIPVRGPVPAAVGKWASGIRVVEMTKGGNFKNKVCMYVCMYVCQQDLSICMCVCM